MLIDASTTSPFVRPYPPYSTSLMTSKHSPAAPDTLSNNIFSRGKAYGIPVNFVILSTRFGRVSTVLSPFKVPPHSASYPHSPAPRPPCPQPPGTLRPLKNSCISTITPLVVASILIALLAARFFYNRRLRNPPLNPFAPIDPSPHPHDFKTLPRLHKWVF